MAAARVIHRCTQCTRTTPRWAGRCPGCGSWNSLAEEVVTTRRSVLRPLGSVAGPDGAFGAGWGDGEQAGFPPGAQRPAGFARSVSPPVPLALAGALEPPAPVRTTGLAEVDRVLSGGLARGSVTLLGGEPGVGKSTLVLQIAQTMASAGATVLVHAAEEGAAQVRARATRLGASPPGLLLSTGEDLDGLLAAVGATGRSCAGVPGEGESEGDRPGRLPGGIGLPGGTAPAGDGPAERGTEAGATVPDVLIVDSIQTVAHPEVAGPPGSVAQVRACAATLAEMARRCACAVVLVGHVTKAGSLAGPRTLEHLVDTVLSFEGDRHHALRFLRVLKHRFGPAGEVGLFEMCAAGLRGVDDPAELLLGDRRPGVPGSVVLPLVDGHAANLVEVQALVTRPVSAREMRVAPRRAAQGIDGGRLAMILAVIDRHLAHSFAGVDVFVSTVGGVRATEPAADLAIAMALVSAASGDPVPEGVAICGEIGLAGEIRRVASTERRLAEAARIGFGRAIVPAPAPPAPVDLVATPVSTLQEAVAALWAGRPAKRPGVDW